MTATIRLANIGKRFNQEWIFKNVNLEINSEDKIAILGYNGSGKSTLLQIICGFVTPSQGTIEYYKDGKLLSSEEVFKHISFASPYIELIEDFTLHEMFDLYASMKPLQKNLSVKEFISISSLENIDNKPIHFFSSGMKQRLKLTFALLSDVEFIFLDEPLSNLDASGVEWYKDLFKNYALSKTVLVCSNNIKEEITFCNKEISILDFKK